MDHSQFQKLQKQLRRVNKHKLGEVIGKVDVTVDEMIATNTLKAQVAGTAFAIDYITSIMQDLESQIEGINEELATLEDYDNV